ncbi:hypothetical protein BHE74_00023013 [Ensete ventricosum]|nr:hypothetical protein BHE74_00023013 [Ensete ventricosum]
MAVVPNISPSTHRLVYAEDMTSTSMSPLRHTIFAEPINVNDSFRFQKRPHSAVDVDECAHPRSRHKCPRPRPVPVVRTCWYNRARRIHVPAHPRSRHKCRILPSLHRRPHVRREMSTSCPVCSSGRTRPFSSSYMRRPRAHTWSTARRDTWRPRAHGIRQRVPRRVDGDVTGYDDIAPIGSWNGD